MGQTLYTLGYEGLSIEAFIQRLKAYQVGTVLDVRALPLSRKPGFSKTAFAQRIQDAGLLYAHVPAMGCPKPIRERYKQDCDWDAYAKSFQRHLAKQGDALVELGKLAREGRCCLVCFEADFSRCHRIFVARAAARSGRLRVVHITDRTAIADLNSSVAA